ncbi:MAG: hypothetical protein HY893_03125 [Deltaproteobacteria bacterium]|nr:hypothetical protein [Deltaproteobacteria bacterium]
MSKRRLKKTLFESFQEKEALSLLLSYALPGKELDMAVKGLLNRFGSLKGIVEAPQEELEAAPGMGAAPASLLRLVGGVSSLYLKDRAKKKNIVRGQGDVIYCLKRIGAPKAERLAAIYLSSANEFLSIDVLHEGSIKGGFSALSRKAVSLSFKHNARSVVFALMCPGKEAVDPGLYRRIIEVLDRAALAVDLLVHDYILTGKGGYFSAREGGWRFGETPGFAMAAELQPSRILPKGMG